jgi:hypothetical protein
VTTDEDILARIERLVGEEDRLRTQTDPGLDDDERGRLADVEDQLDRCWDLLRQRRARRGAGLDPDGAEPRETDDYVR